MNTNFKSGFEKTAFVNLLGKGVKAFKGFSKSTGNTFRAIPEKIKTDYSRGLQGKGGISFSQAKKQVALKDSLKKAQETRDLNKIKNQALKEKRMQAVQKAKETKAQNMQKKQEVQKAQTAEKQKTLAKNVGLAGAGALGGGMIASRAGASQPDESQYRYASAKGLDKTSGIIQGVKNMSNFLKATMGSNKPKINLDLKLNQEQLDTILKKVDEVKPKIGPLHVLGGSILAGMGAPIGAAIMKGTASGAKEVLNSPPSSMYPTNNQPRASYVQPDPTKLFR